MAQGDRDAQLGPGGFYEAVPYASMPFGQSQPAHLAAMAALFGCRPPAIATARVLELGCASGGNIIPLAARFPQARFTGIDLSLRHVALAQERIAAHRLGNVEVVQGDIGAPGAVEGQYDYILCHGVFSWVPETVQEAIFAILRDHLAPGGIGYVSYNVLPGWHQRQIVRDIMRIGGGAEDAPEARVAKGRELLGQLAAVSSSETPYGQLLRREAEQLGAAADSYLLGEFFAEDNAPCYFTDFAARAAAAGLTYVSDTDIARSLPGATSADFGQLLQNLAGGDRIRAEQFFDLFQGRQFRQSLLCRSGDAPPGGVAVEPTRLADLHLTGALRRDPAHRTPGEFRLATPSGRSITTNDPLLAYVVEAIGAAAPGTRALSELLAEAGAAGREEGALERVCASLLQLAAAGLVAMSAAPLRLGRANDARPEAWAFSRADAAQGEASTTTLKHAVVRLDEAMRGMVVLVDGTRDAEEIAAEAARRRDAGKLSLPPGDLAPVVAHTLAELERMALLVPTDSEERGG